jgi:hypothetical protein
MKESAPMNEIDPNTGMIETEFLKKFRKKFSSSDADNAPWPRQSTDTPLEYANEFVAVFRSMFMLLEHDIVPPEGPARSARQLIKELIAETGWPDGESVPVPEPWIPTRYRAFRRYEIACAINILMQLFNKGGPGGDPSGYPPKRPA